MKASDQRPPRVAFISEHASPFALLGSVDAGGQNVYVDEVSRHLVRNGFLVDVFTRRDAADLPEVIAWAEGVRIINLAVGPAQFVPKDALWPLMPEFRDALVAWAAQRNVQYDLLHGNFWMSGWVAAELKRRWQIPAVQIFHATGKTKQQHQGDADTSPAERIMVETGVIRDVDRVIAQCPAEWSELIEEYGAAPSSVSVIPSAVNIARFRPVPQADARRHIGLALDELVVAYVGRMQPRKDVRNVVRAVAHLIHAHQLPVKLLLVGGETHAPDPVATPEIGVLQSIAQELGISDHLVFIGKRQPDELHLYYSAGDVAVTTPWYEPFGLTPLEAQACGRPIVGSAVGGLTYTIADGETGLLVPPRDPVALAAALHRLLRDPALRQRMGHAARVRVEREFTWPTVAQRTAAVYQELLGQSPDT